MSQKTVAVEKERPSRALTRSVLQKPLTLEKLAMVVQRVSGLGILTYLFFHIFVTGTVGGSRAVWEGMMLLFSNPFARTGELLLLVGSTFHGINGIRVVLLELTGFVGRPARPDYPYKAQSLGPGQRSLLYAAIIMAGLSVIVGLIILWGS